jgi:hypothetical protein
MLQHPPKVSSIKRHEPTLFTGSVVFLPGENPDSYSEKRLLFIGEMSISPMRKGHQETHTKG